MIVRGFLLVLCLIPAVAVAHPHGHSHGHDHDHHSHDGQLDSDTDADRAFGPEASWARALLRPLPQTSERELLRARATGAPVVAVGEVREKRVKDEGRLYLGQVSVKQVFRGDGVASPLSLVDFRGARSAPEYLAPGLKLFLVLEPTPTHSYLRDHLDEGDHYSPAGALNEPLVLENADSAQALADWLALGASPTTDISRAVALRLLVQGDLRLSRLALAELSRVTDPGPLTESEQGAIERVMAEDLPGKGELALRLAHWDLTDVSGLLLATGNEDPVTRTRLALARYALGGEPDLDWALSAVVADDAETRAAAVRVLGLVDDDRAREAASERALADEDVDVRIVALYSLAQSGDERTHDVLRQALDSPAQSLRFQAGRALRYLDTRPLAEVLRDTVREADHREAREYAAKLMVFYLGRDHGAVASLRHNLEEGEVRRILTEGAVDRSRVHSHDVHEH